MGKRETWVGQAAESKGKARPGLCGWGATRRRAECRQKFPARRGDVTAPVVLAPDSGRETTVLYYSMDVSMSSECTTLEYSEASSPSEKRWLKLSRRAVPAGESRKRRLDHSPIRRLLSSAASHGRGHRPCQVTLGIAVLDCSEEPAKGRYHPAPARDLGDLGSTPGRK